MNKIDLTQTFVNHDELRGWGIKGLRRHRGDFTGYKNKRFIQAMVAFGFAYTGFLMFGDLMEKKGFWRGVNTLIDEKWDAEYLKDAKDNGYDMYWEQQQD